MVTGFWKVYCFRFFWFLNLWIYSNLQESSRFIHWEWNKLREGRKTEEGGEHQEKVFENMWNTPKRDIKNILKMS